MSCDGVKTRTQTPGSENLSSNAASFLWSLCNHEFSLMVLFFWCGLNEKMRELSLRRLILFWVGDPFSSSQGLEEIIKSNMKIRSYLEFLFPKVIPPHALYLLLFIFY